MRNLRDCASWSWAMWNGYAVEVAGVTVRIVPVQQLQWWVAPWPYGLCRLYLLIRAHHMYLYMAGSGEHRTTSTDQQLHQTFLQSSDRPNEIWRPYSASFPQYGAWKSSIKGRFGVVLWCLSHDASWPRPCGPLPQQAISRTGKYS